MLCKNYSRPRAIPHGRRVPEISRGITMPTSWCSPAFCCRVQIWLSSTYVMANRFGLCLSDVSQLYAGRYIGRSSVFTSCLPSSAMPLDGILVLTWGKRKRGNEFKAITWKTGSPCCPQTRTLKHWGQVGFYTDHVEPFGCSAMGPPSTNTLMFCPETSP